MSVDDMLGIDSTDPLTLLANGLVASDHKMLAELVAIRRKKMSQEQAAAKMGVSQSAVAHIEAGRRDAKLSTLRRYAMAIGALVNHGVTDIDETSPAAGVTHEAFEQSYLSTSGVSIFLTVVGCEDGGPIEPVGGPRRVDKSWSMNDLNVFFGDSHGWIQQADAASQAEDEAEAPV